MIHYKLRTFIAVVLFASVIVIFYSHVFANSSHYYEYDKDGFTVYPVENKNIVMQAELVQIYPDTRETWRINKTWHAKCEYIFYNKSDSEETVIMGYPDWLYISYDGADESFKKYFESLPEKTRKSYYYQVGTEEAIFDRGYRYAAAYFQGYKEGKLPYISKAWNLQDLKVTVFWKEVETTHKAVVNAGSLPGEGAFIWKITFAPHETKAVDVSFSFSGAVEGEIENDNYYQKVSYILRTGALWADKIGIADIYWDIKDRNVNFAKIVPRNYTVENNIIHWHFEDFKPKEDIVITIGEKPDQIISALLRIYKSKTKYDGNSRYYTEKDLHNMDYDKIFKPYINELKTKSHRLYVKTLRNEIYARHGREFNSSDILDIFGHCDWYQPNDNYSDDMLNQYEKKNLEFISAYEKQKGWR